MRPLISLLAALLAAGCATSLSTLDTAQTTARGHLQAEIGMGFYVQTGPIGDIISAADDVTSQAKSGQIPSFTDEQQEKLYEAALGLLLMPPSALSEIAVRSGIIENLDLGLKLSTTATRLDAKYRSSTPGTSRAGAPTCPSARRRPSTRSAGSWPTSSSRPSST